MVYSSQRGQALLEIIATVMILLGFTFLYFNFSIKTEQVLNTHHFGRSTK